MPPQHIEVAETVAALRRKLKRDKEATSSTTASANQTAQFASNRGNKLKSGVRNVHAGSMPYMNGLGGYRERINHAGYTRPILQRNPTRTNEYGDELEDSESDPEADLDAEEQNPYADVRLEELLRPLTHPSELANHPSMAQAYLDPALPEMVTATEAKIREERNNLWNAKNLYRHFLGDESWIPCERTEHVSDWQLFEPNPASSGRLAGGESPSKRRKLDTVNLPNGGKEADVQIMDGVEETNINGLTANERRSETPKHNIEQPTTIGTGKPGPESDVEMADMAEPTTNGIHKHDEPKEPNGETANEGSERNLIDEHTEQIITSSSVEQKNAPDPNPSPTEGMADNDATKGEGNDDENNQSSSPNSTPPLPTRRITRALAAEGATPQVASPPPTSPTLSIQSPSLLEPHPLFLLPPSLAAYHAPHSSYPVPVHLAHSGLPPEELLETRKLLSLYIQKSEETIRGLESIYAKLFKAKRRRDLVWEWSIAEGHVGEMSDGEDWVDVDKWGITREELRKGRDEDNGGEVAANGEDDAGAGAGTSGGGVVMGGRKGKRRRTAAGGKDKDKDKDKERDKDREKE